MAIGTLRIPILEWPLWTLRQFYMALESWKSTQIIEPWKRTRALSFYQLISQGAKLNRWEDVFSLANEKKRKLQKAVIRKPTAEEERDFKEAMKLTQPI